MAARQDHGFKYEEKCFADFPWWEKSDNYTSKWDGYDTELEKQFYLCRGCFRKKS